MQLAEATSRIANVAALQLVSWDRSDRAFAPAGPEIGVVQQEAKVILEASKRFGSAVVVQR